MRKLIFEIKTKISSLRLRTQLIILMASVTFLLLFVQCTYTVLNYQLLRNNTTEYAESLMTQTEKSISTFLNGMVDATNAVSTNTSVQEYLMNQNPVVRYSHVKFIQSFIRYIVSSNDGIQDIAILNADNQIIFYSNAPVFEIHQALAETHPDYASSEYNVPFLDMVTTSSGTYCVYVSPVYMTYSSYRLGSIITIYNNRNIQSIIESTNLTPSTCLYLYNEENTILASNDYATLNEKLPSSLCVSDSVSSIQFNGKRSIVKTYNIQEFGWHLTCVIPEKEFLKGVGFHNALTIIMTLFTLLLLLFLSSTIWRNIASPIQKLTDQLDKIGYINRHQRVSVYENGTKNEIVFIGYRINKMLDKIEELNNKIFQTQSSLYETELLKKEAELYALQNQINPHFLYNTLDCIRSIALMYQADEISSIALSMSKMFRYCIQKEAFVTVEQELNCIKDYLNIMQIRYMNRFHIMIDINPEMYHQEMPKFLLQPLVENAFYHGLERKSSPGSFQLTGNYTSTGKMQLIVYDTGVGIPSKTLNDILTHLSNGSKPDGSKKHTGIGLANIHARIRSLYGEPYGLSLESVEGKWTRITILLPIKNQN